MLKSLLIRDSLPNKISYYLVMLLLAALSFDQFYSHAIFSCFAVHTLIHLKKEKIRQLLTPSAILLQAIYFITLIGFTYTAYRADAAIDVTRQLMILLFPVFFAITSLDLKKYRDDFLRFFAVMCTATVAYLYIHAFMVVRFYHMPVKSLISPWFINHNFSTPIAMHATFFSLQVAVAFFYFVSQLIHNNIVSTRRLYFCAAVLLFAGLVQLGSKSVLIAVLIGLNIGVPYFLLTAGERVKYILIACTFSLVLMAGALSSKTFRARYITGLKTDLSSPGANETTYARLPRWEAGLRVAARSPITGYGIGSEQQVLSEEFYKQKLYNAFLNRFNAHNQYLSFLISSGVTGLIVYLATLLWGFKVAFAQRDAMFFFFMLIIATASCSESILYAEKGVIFYSIFFSFFVFSGQYKNRGIMV